MKREFEPLGYKITSKELPKTLVAAGSIFNPEFKLVLKIWNYAYSFDVVESQNLLGMKYRNVGDSVLEMTHSMIDWGAIPDKRKAKL